MPSSYYTLDLTQESLSGCKEFSESDIQELAQDFSNSISWDPKPVPDYLQEYFSKNCEDYQIKEIKQLYVNIQFMQVQYLVAISIHVIFSKIV
ncbi:unnamed protein product [Rhizophagus irregularis]|nr:unnamed protein product [Rhizophagus irregularis]